MNKTSIPGWTINIDENSNGVFKVTLTDAYGHKAEVIGNATGETIERATGDAFDIEKEISQHWNLFLYNLAVQKLSDKNVEHKEYKDEAFGSWFIERQDKRLVYDGKDSWLVFQTKIKNDWTDIEIIENNELKYSNFVRQINRLTETSTLNNLTAAGPYLTIKAKKIIGYIFIALAIILTLTAVGLLSKLIGTIFGIFKIFTGALDSYQIGKIIGSSIYWTVHITLAIKLWIYGRILIKNKTVE